MFGVWGLSVPLWSFKLSIRNRRFDVYMPATRRQGAQSASYTGGGFLLILQHDLEQSGPLGKASRA
jgi:hypothetical protein